MVVNTIGHDPMVPAEIKIAGWSMWSLEFLMTRYDDLWWGLRSYKSLQTPSQQSSHYYAPFQLLVDKFLFSHIQSVGETRLRCRNIDDILADVVPKAEEEDPLVDRNHQFFHSNPPGVASVMKSHNTKIDLAAVTKDECKKWNIILKTVKGVLSRKKIASISGILQGMNEYQTPHNPQIPRELELEQARNALRTPPPSSRGRKMAEARQAKEDIWTYFKATFHQMARQKIFERLQTTFPNAARCWRRGQKALRSTTRGHVPRNLESVMALLCVCYSIARTLDRYTEKVRQGCTYQERFKEDIPRWYKLFSGEDLWLFTNAVSGIWNAETKLETWWEFGSDYPGFLRRAQGLVLDLSNETEGLFEILESSTSDQLPRPNHQASPLFYSAPRSPDLGGAMEALLSTPSDEDRRGPDFMGTMWVFLLSGSIFAMLLTFLIWFRCLLLCSEIGEGFPSLEAGTIVMRKISGVKLSEKWPLTGCPVGDTPWLEEKSRGLDA
ncbi:hypothetical protein TWF730_009361 [Orbilia blumenaviensis]|uniref:Uncharacterized protein n=1 Tax=Orbilia blumenaviensis TaxID=1796055 RepID=A0AAV9UY24_9PEZI